MSKQNQALEILSRVPVYVGKRLKALALPHIERGILPSEMAALCGIVEAVGATRIIESGRWLGYSTEVLSAYYKDSPLVQIDSIEYFRSAQAKICERRLAHCTNVNLLYGDATKIVPGMLEGRTEPTVLLFDGPKGWPAVRLLKKVLDTYPQVRAVCLHDCYKDSEARNAMIESFPNCTFTDDPAFLKRFSYLDQGIAVGKVHPEKYSGSIDSLEKSYGPTLGIAFPDESIGRKNHSMISSVNAYLWWSYGTAEAFLRETLYTLRNIFKR